MPSKFSITGFVAYPPKGIGLRVKCLDGSREKTLEVLCFDKQNANLSVGQEVRITGDLGTKKTEFTRQYNGKDYPFYVTQLVAREVVAVGPEAVKKLPKEQLPDPDQDVPF